MYIFFSFLNHKIMDCKKENVSEEKEVDIEKRNERREEDVPEVDRKDQDESKDVGSMGSPRVSGSDQADRISVGSNTVKSGINIILIKHNNSGTDDSSHNLIF